MICFNIADKIFEIKNEYTIIEEDKLASYYSPFLPDYKCNSDYIDYRITVKHSDYKEFKSEGEFITKNFDYRIYKNEKGYVIEYYQKHFIRDEVFCVCQLFIPFDWSELTFIDYADEEERIAFPENFKPIFSCMTVYITGVLLIYNTFTLHSAALQYNGKGLCFTGSSGVGKTTHTNFWVNKFGAEIINGDSPFIKIIDTKPYIYGSPWCGGSGITKNRNVPLDAVIVIKQSSENRIRKLSKFEAVSLIFGQIRRPMWDEKAIDKCLTYAEMLADTISVYELECLPNAEAADTALAGIEELHG